MRAHQTLRNARQRAVGKAVGSGIAAAVGLQDLEQPHAPPSFLFGIVDQAGRVFDALLDAVRRRYVCDLARDCVVLILYPVETINREPSPSLLAFGSQSNDLRIHVARSRHIILVERGRRAIGVGRMEIISGLGGAVWEDVSRPTTCRATTTRWRDLAVGHDQHPRPGWQPHGGPLR